MERKPRVVRVLAVLLALVAAAGKVVDRVLYARRRKLEAVLRRIRKLNLNGTAA